MVRADSEDCLAVPSQKCVFELAIEAAEAQKNRAYWASGMMRVALLQELSGSEQSHITLAHFIAELPKRIPHLRSRISILSLPSKNMVTNTPHTSKKIASIILDMAPPRGGKMKYYANNIATIYLAYAGEREQILDLIRSSYVTQQIEIVKASAAGHIALGDMDGLGEFVDMLPTEEARNLVRLTIVSELIKHGDIGQAEQVASTMSDMDLRFGGYRIIAEAYLRNRHFPDAQRIGHYLEDNFQVDPQIGFRRILENIHAELGDEEKLRAIIRTGENTKETKKRTDLLLATAAMVNGDLDTFFAHLDHLDEDGDQVYAGWITARSLALTYLASGQADITRFVEYFAANRTHDRSNRDVYLRLEVLGKIQADQGDLDGAMNTFWRATFVEDLTPVDKFDGSFNPRRFALIRLMVERGMVKEALERAYERQDSVALAMLAAMLD